MQYVMLYTDNNQFLSVENLNTTTHFTRGYILKNVCPLSATPVIDKLCRTIQVVEEHLLIPTAIHIIYMIDSAKYNSIHLIAIPSMVWY